MQAAAGDPRAGLTEEERAARDGLTEEERAARDGLTEEERAARDGLLAAPLTGADQTFRPIALDLDGDGIEVTDRAHGLAFDVDGSGYLKQTAWLKADDAFLVLDRNYNGQFDNGSELFSNATVALQRRGLAGLKWVDANGDGRITALDPVWSELKVWRDANQNARQDAGEVQGLDALGITALNPGMATYTRAGVQRQLGSPDLQADRQGSRATVVPEGILVQTSEAGELSLVVIRGRRFRSSWRPIRSRSTGCWPARSFTSAPMLPMRRPRSRRGLASVLRHCPGTVLWCSSRHSNETNRRTRCR